MPTQSQRNLQVGLCGAGLGGLTAAIAIARAGADVTVLEAAAELGEIGAGIQMTPNVSRFLVRWGVSDIIGTDLVQCDRVQLRNIQGQLIGGTNFKKVVRDYGFPWWVVHRHHLHSGLAESARRHGVNLVVDARVTEIQYSDDLSKYSKVKVKTEKQGIYEFDLLVGSDGLKSVVRKTLFPDVKPTALTKNAAYRAVIPYAKLFSEIPEAKAILGNNVDLWTSPGAYCITYPISGGKDLNLVLSHHADKYVEEVEEANMAEVRDFYSQYDPIVQKLIRLIPQSSRWPLLVTGPMKSWSNKAKNIVLIGDAAHSMTNHIAQGAATSMEDGAFLGQAISEVMRGTITLSEAIDIYEKTRMPHVYVKQQASFFGGEASFAPFPEATVRYESSRAEVDPFFQNVTNPLGPPAHHRSWNLGGSPDSIPGIYSYDAEGDADKAICEYLSKNTPIDPETRVAKGLRDKWYSWQDIEGRKGERQVKWKL